MLRRVDVASIEGGLRWRLLRAAILLCDLVALSAGLVLATAARYEGAISEANPAGLLLGLALAARGLPGRRSGTAPAPRSLRRRQRRRVQDPLHRGGPDRVHRAGRRCRRRRPAPAAAQRAPCRWSALVRPHDRVPADHPEPAGGRRPAADRPADPGLRRGRRRRPTDPLDARRPRRASTCPSACWTTTRPSGTPASAASACWVGATGSPRRPPPPSPRSWSSRCPRPAPPSSGTSPSGPRPRACR